MTYVTLLCCHKPHLYLSYVRSRTNRVIFMFLQHVLEVPTLSAGAFVLKICCLYYFQQ
jgi:hypothetical protein